MALWASWPGNEVPQAPVGIFTASYAAALRTCYAIKWPRDATLYIETTPLLAPPASIDEPAPAIAKRAPRRLAPATAK